MRKLFLASLVVLFSMIYADATYTSPGSVTITGAGTYHFTAAGTYTVNFALPANAYNKKISSLELIGGGGGGGGGYSNGQNGSAGATTVFLVNSTSYLTASYGNGGVGAGGAGGTGQNSGTTYQAGGAGGAGFLGDGNGGKAGNGVNSLAAGEVGQGGIGGSGYGAGGGSGAYLWSTIYFGGGSGGSGYQVFDTNISIDLTKTYQVNIGAGGGGGAGGYYDATIYGGAGGAGNRGYAKLVISYLLATENYYFKNSSGSTTNITSSDTVSLMPTSYSNPENYLGHVTINQVDLGISIFDNDFSDIVIAKDSNNNPYVSVPAGSDLATAVNGNNKWVPIKLGPFTKQPVIKYSADGNSWTAITDYAGAALDSGIRNYVFDGEYVTFEVNHFSTYGTAVLDSVVFTDAEITTTSMQSSKVITVNVLDNTGEGIENAPVTFSIESGNGLLNGSSSDKVIYTNASGVATINYTYPNQAGANIVKADLDGTFDTIIMNVPGGLSAQELAQYNAWVSNNSYVIGDQNDDDDGDGLTNVKEWNYGTDSTNPLLADTDTDGLNDKYDAYPNNISLKIFNTNYNPNIAATENFTGTAKNASILAASANLVLETLFDTGYSRKASVDLINDNSLTIKEINGLAKEAVQDGNLAFASTTYSDDIYRSLQPGEAYSVLFCYINRGNDTDSYGTTVNLIQAVNRWNITYSNSGLSNVAPWQRAELEVSVLPAAANAFEKTTLNVTIGYDAGVAVSYNRYPAAYALNTYANEGRYGGADSFDYTFKLEAEGYDLSIVSRETTVNVPTDYTGTFGLVPGAKIKYTIAIHNNSQAVATSINLTDTIPNSCHLYYTATPNVTGADAWEWKGATSNAATSAINNAINFEITIPARSTVTANYTVTVD